MTAGRLPLIALFALAVALTQARAAPLDADTCAKLQTEQAQLEDAGVGKDMAKGAAWARDNLGLQKLQQVQRFIEIEEQLLFRCRSKVIVHLSPGAGAKQDKGDDENGDGKSAPSKAAGKNTQPAAKPAAPPKKHEPAKRAKAAARDSAQPGVTSIMKRPPKAKVDDAYQVPPPDPSIDPFATQLVPAED